MLPYTLVIFIISEVCFQRKTHCLPILVDLDFHMEFDVFKIFFSHYCLFQKLMRRLKLCSLNKYVISY